MHTDHNNNDAVLLAGGGYMALKDFGSVSKPYRCTDHKHYDLQLLKISVASNNVVLVNGYVMGVITESFEIDPAFLPTEDILYKGDGNNTIVIWESGSMAISNATGYR